jgi:hypothetical protein
MIENYLIDESIIVYLDRNDYKYHRQLVAFLEDGMKGKKDRKYTFFMPKSCKFKLGAFWWYKQLTYLRRITIDSRDRTALEKAKTRTAIAKTYIIKYLNIKIVRRFFIFNCFPRKLIDVFIYANEAKSKELQRTEKRKIESDEIISLDTCKVAMLAHNKKYKLISFNKNFKYLQMLPPGKNAYIVYVHPDDILRNYFNGA